ncbi:MAG: death-on-curing protein [Rhodothermales bacterium]
MTRATPEPAWLTVVHTRMLHAESVRLFGGAPGVRDHGLRESAIDRPRNLWSHDEATTVFDLAAAYGFGLAKNHAFIDGNKRVALLAMRAFLHRNGFSLTPPEVATVTTIEGLAAGSIDEVTLAVWLQKHSVRRL